MRAWFRALAVVAIAMVGRAATAETITALTEDWKKAEGFIPFFTKGDSEAVLLQVEPGQDFLYGLALAQGAGSRQPLLEPAGLDDLRLCRFERAGRRVLLIQRVTEFREGGSAEGSRALRESFARSVIASFPVLAEEDGRVLIDAGSFLIDGQHVRPWIREGWTADAARSLVLLERSGAFPRNTELEVLVTLAGDGKANFVSPLLPDTRSLSLRVRHTFLQIPEAGFETRLADPRVGFFGASYHDLAAERDQRMDHRLAARWRLVKRDGSLAVSEPSQPIVLYVDPAIPEAYRDAVRRGALFWNRAFEAAGFQGAVVLRDLPEGASFLDARFSGIQWVHRAQGGFAIGHHQLDPRTGEIVHGVVNLDSAFTRSSPNEAGQPMFLGAGACGLSGEPAPGVALGDGIVLQKIAYITAHEVGHILGLAHNMAGSSYGGSVMDYLAANLRLESGRVVTDEAYPAAVGAYDEMAIRWAYTPGLPASGLESIVREGLGRGLVFPQEDDARWAQWDLGPDPVAWLETRVALRKSLLSELGPGALRDGEPMQELYRRFESVYTMHLPAVAAATRLVGGVQLVQAGKGDGQKPFAAVGRDAQRRALEAVLATLAPENLAVPPALEPELLPGPLPLEQPSFLSETGLSFSPVGRGRELAREVVFGLLVDGDRLARLAAARAADSLTLDEVLSTVEEHAWRPVATKDVRALALEHAVQAVVVDTLLLLAGLEGEPAEARAALLDHVVRLRALVVAGPTADTATRAHVRFLRRQIDEFLALPRAAD